MRPVLIGCAHGTRAPEGQQTIRNLLAGIHDHLGVEVREAYVDVQDPRVDDVVAAVPAATSGVSAVVVPLLLAGGYHVYVDIAQAIDGRTDVRAAPPLGPDPRLIDIAAERITEAGIPPGTALVLAAAGSSDPRSQDDTRSAAEYLRGRWDAPVTIGFAAGPKPSVADAVAVSRSRYPNTPVAVVSYLLAPGLFQRRLDAAGADFVTAPLAPHPLLVQIVAERFRAQWSA